MSEQEEANPREIIAALLREHRRLLKAIESAKLSRLGYVSLINAQAKLLKNLLDFMRAFGVGEKGEDLAQLLSRVAEKRGLMAVKPGGDAAALADEIVKTATELMLGLGELARTAMRLRTLVGEGE